MFELFVPLVVADIIDHGIAGGDKSYIIGRSLILVALGVIGLVCSLTAQYFAARAAVGSSCSIRRALYEHIQKLSFSARASRRSSPVSRAISIRCRAASTLPSVCSCAPRSSSSAR